jgi:uncharacterized protein (TIGR03437 family)
MSRLVLSGGMLMIALWPTTALAQTPQIGGVTNGASFSTTTPLAPGVIFSVFGSSMTDGTSASASDIPLPTRLAGARLLADGTAVPLFFASPGQINAQLPTGLSGNTVSLQVEVQGSNGTLLSTARVVSSTSTSPGVFTLDQNGSGPGAILKTSDFSKICPPARADCSTNPATRGEPIAIYATGLGTVQGTLPIGDAATQALETTATTTASVGGYPAQVLYAGLAVGFAGLYQVNVVVPANVPTGPQVPVTVSVGGRTSNVVTVAVEPLSGPTTQLGGGPAGANILAIKADPTNSNIVYAMTDSAFIVFKSTDGGLSWIPSGNGIQPFLPEYRAFEMDPSTPSTLYIGMFSGAYRSLDGGATWTASNAGLPSLTGVPNLSIQALAADPLNPGTVFAVSNNPVGNSLDSNRIYKSTNSGSSWNQIPTNPGGTSNFAITVEMDASGILYAGTVPQGVLKSADGGSSWTHVNFSAASTDVEFMASDPTEPGVVYAAAAAGILHSSTPGGQVSGSVNGLFRTTDGGASWADISAGIPSSSPVTFYQGQLSVSATNPRSILLAIGKNLYRTTDGGASWIRLSEGLTINGGLTTLQINAIGADNINPQTLYAGTENTGIYKSQDGGDSWQASAVGMTGTHIYAQAIDPLNSAHLYAATGQGLYQSADAGKSWAGINSGLPSAVRLVMEPGTGTRLYAATAAFDAPNSGAVYKSGDGGLNWSPSNSGLSLGPGDLAVSIAVDPVSPSTIYAGTNSSGIYKSINGGDSWSPASAGIAQPLSSHRVTAVVINPTAPNTLYAAVTGFSSDVMVYKSTDGGATWVAASKGLTNLTSGVSTLIIDPANPNTLYAGSTSFTAAVFKSLDGGANWTSVSLGMISGGSITTLAIDPQDSSILYAGSSQGSKVVFKSSNAGTSWTALGNAGLPNATSNIFNGITTLSIDPNNRSTIYAGTQAAGLFKSTDGGQTWNPTGAN